MDKNSKFMNAFLRRKSNRGVEIANRLAAIPEEGVNNLPEGNAGSGTQETLPKSVDMDKLLRFLFWRKKS